MHVREYLAKYERCCNDLELLRDMETQIVVLRAVGELLPTFRVQGLGFGVLELLRYSGGPDRRPAPCG